MSYFCANTISINKQDNTCTVTGGDNNVIPRDNYKSKPFPLRELVRELSGGMIQFTTRSDKNVHIEKLAFTVARELKELTGLDAYTLGNILKGTKYLEDTEKALYQTIGEYQSEDSHMSESYREDQIIEAQQLLDIIHDNVILFKINALLNRFVEEVKKPIPKTKFIITINGMFIRRKGKRNAYMTIAKSEAQQFSQAKAEDIAQNYIGAEVIAL